MKNALYSNWKILTVYGAVDIVDVTRRIAGWLAFQNALVCRLKEAGEDTERRHHDENHDLILQRGIADHGEYQGTKKPPYA